MGFLIPDPEKPEDPPTSSKAEAAEVEADISPESQRNVRNRLSRAASRRGRDALRIPKPQGGGLAIPRG